MITRRTLLARLVAGAGVTLLGGSGCRPSPGPGACPAVAGRHIRWIVPNAPGGGYDTESRLLQPFLEQRLGARILVENLAGAGGLVGARAIADATPDGLTLGIAGMPGLLVAALVGQPAALDPIRAFTILGRVSRSAHVWAAGAESALTTIDEVLAAGRRRPLVFAINEVGSANFVSITVSAALLHVPAALVPGFSGTRAACLAAARGDVDVVCFDFDTIRPLIAAGELRAVLQLSHGAIATDPLLGRAPLLGGPDGLADRLARAAGEDAAWARQIAGALARLIGSGRVVVAPRGLAPALAACLSNAIQDALATDGLRDRAARSVDAADAAAARADVDAAASEAAQLFPLIEPALAKLRG